MPKVSSRSGYLPRHDFCGFPPLAFSSGFGQQRGIIGAVLAALNIGAVMAGVAAGGLVASVIGFGLSWILTLIGLDSGPGIGLMIGIATGLIAAGWLAGTRARHSERFHGAVTGLIMAFVIMVIAILGGSPAPTTSVLLLALIAIVVSGLSGWLAGRRKLARL